jgi:hypothetical protein
VGLRQSAFLAALILGFIPGCESSPTEFELEVDRLQAAPDTLGIAGRTLTLEADLWRDFLLVQTDPPLTTSITVADVLSRDIPEAIEVAHLWVIVGYDLWEVPADLAGWTRRSPDRMELIFTGGPHWAVGTRADVVVGILDPNGELHRVRVADREVRGTF